MYLKYFSILIVLVLHYEYVSSQAVLCYYASWANHRSGNGKVTPEDIDPTLCTHINYAFLGLEYNGTLKILDPELDIEQNGIKRISALKKINPNLKCIFSLGGYTAGSDAFLQITADPEKMATMAQSAIDFMKEYDFDGLDVDWEYPLEKAPFITLLEALKRAFEPHGYLLTAAVAAIPTDAAYDVPAMSNILDFINVMTYDFHGTWAGFTAQNSPLYASSTEGEWQRDNLNANSSITHWIESGADPAKLAVGIAFYGHSFVLVDENNYGLGAPSSGPAEPGPFTDNQGSLGYNELCEFHQNAGIIWDDVQKVPFLHDGKLWVGFDNPRSVKEKAQYALDKNLGGVMIWSIETDDYQGLCGEKLALSKAIREIIP